MSANIPPLVSPERLEEIRKLRAAITPGQWQVVRQARSLSEAGKRAMPDLAPPDAIAIATVASDPTLGDVWPVVTLAESGFFDPSCRIAIEDADAVFIAAAPQIVDDLLAEHARLTALLAGLRADGERLDRENRALRDDLAYAQSDASRAKRKIRDHKSWGREL